MLFATLVALMLATYCICGIPFGLILSRAKGVDVRSTGSGNIGTTNVARSVGAGVALATLTLDMLKGFVCTYFGSMVLAAACFGGDASAVAPSGAYGWTVACIFLAAVCGHVFSPYLGFKGGKGVAVGFGAALGFAWPIALGLLVIWALTAVPSRFVSAGSVCAAASAPFLAFFIYYPAPFSFLAPFILVAVVVVWAHRENLKKLRSGEESKFALHREGAAQEHEVEREVMDAQAGLPEEDEPVAAPFVAAAAPVTEEALEVSDAEKEALEEQSAEDAAAGEVTVTDVEVAQEEAAEKDADKIPAPGEGVFFGDEPAVTEHVEDRVKKIHDEK